MICGVSAVVLAFTVNDKVGSYMGVVWARLISYITPMWLTVTGRENIDKQRSYVIVSNHQSQYDIMALYGWLGVDFKWVMKIELRKVPFLGIACEKLGHIYIDRSRSHKALESINAAKKKISGGTSVLFFPEGTRSKTTEMLIFRKGAFNMALDLDIPILPVTIEGTRKILPTETINLFPGHARMRIHPPVDIAPYRNRDLAELMDDVRAIIHSALD